MNPKPPCPACGQPPASMIEDGYSIDLTPWWRYYVQKFNPFKRRRRTVPMEDVVPLLDVLGRIENEGCSHTNRSRNACETYDQVHFAYAEFLSKHPLP